MRMSCLRIGVIPIICYGTWGYLAKVAIPIHKKEKICMKIVDYVFIDYAQNRSAYRFLVYESTIPDIHKNTYMEFRNASFFEYIFSYRSIVNIVQ